jgi:hypothetical protein
VFPGGPGSFNRCGSIPIAPPAGDGASKWTWLRLRLLSARGKRASDRRSPHHSDAVAREVIHLRRRGPRCAVPTCRDLRRTTPPRHRQRGDAARLMASRASRRVADFGEIIRPAWQIGPPNASPPSVGASNAVAPSHLTCRSNFTGKLRALFSHTGALAGEKFRMVQSTESPHARVILW